MSRAAIWPVKQSVARLTHHREPVLNSNSEVTARAERGCPQPERFEHGGAVQKFSGRSSSQPARDSHFGVRVKKAIP